MCGGGDARAARGRRPPPPVQVGAGYLIPGRPPGRAERDPIGLFRLASARVAMATPGAPGPMAGTRASFLRADGVSIEPCNAPVRNLRWAPYRSLNSYRFLELDVKLPTSDCVKMRVVDNSERCNNIFNSSAE